MKKCCKNIFLTLLVGVFSLSLLSITNVNAMAVLPDSFEGIPETLDLTNCDYSDQVHFYFTGNTFMYGKEKAEGRIYNTDGSVVDCYSGGGTTMDAEWFDWTCTSRVRGLYYLEQCHGFHPCDHTPAPVSETTDSHQHSWTHGVIYEATETTDGLEGDMCSCGAVMNTSPISAFRYACDEAETKLDNYKTVPAGADFTLDMGRWNSFPKDYMEAIASRSDVNLTIKIEYEHKKYELYIPAGTAIDTSLDWYGPLKLMEMFEYKQLN